MKTYELRTYPRTARELSIMLERGELSFDNAVQRSFVWKNTARDNRMSMLIDSILRGLPVPPVYANCIFTDPNDKTYDFIDGKQRVLTITKFYSNGFCLIGLPTFETEDGEEADLNGLSYDGLPEEFKDRVRSFALQVNYYENMDQEDSEEMFRRLNNGKSLSAIELTRASAASREAIIRLGQHPFFHRMLTERSIAGYANEDIVIKMYALLHAGNKSFETKDVRALIKEAYIDADTETELRSCLDKYAEMYDALVLDTEAGALKGTARKALTKTHMLMSMLIVRKCTEEGIPATTLEQWFKHFFGTGDRSILSISPEYNDSMKGSSGDAEIRRRSRMLLDDFEDWAKDN